MLERDITLIELSPDLHPVIVILLFIGIYEDLGSATLLHYHVYVSVIGQFCNLEIIFEVPQINNTRTIMFIKVRKHPKANIGVTSQLVRSKLEIVQHTNYEITDR